MARLTTEACLSDREEPWCRRRRCIRTAAVRRVAPSRFTKALDQAAVGRRIRSLVEGWAQQRGSSPADGLRYWQERALDTLLLVGVVLGVVAWLPSVLLSLREDLYGIAALDTILFVLAIVLLIRRDLPYAVRATGVVLICFVLGVVLLLVLGPFSGGPVWLFVPPVLAGILGGPRVSVLALLVNAVTLVAIGILTGAGVLAVPDVDNPQARWLVCCANFMLLDTLAAVGVALVVRGLQGSLDDEFRVRESLRERNVELCAAQDSLGAEIVRRRQAQEQLREHHDHLESVVARRTADLQFRNEEMRLFAYSISHDLRNPLRAIAGFGEILLNEHGQGLDETGRHYLERMRAGARQMDRLIDGILWLSRSSRSEMHYETVDLSRVAAEIVDDLRRREPARVVEVTIAPSLVVSGDRTLLGSALENLLGNAWKFTGRRRCGQIEFGVGDSNGDPTYFVRDNGTGFNMEYVEKLFGAFQRLHGDSEFPGTGIGLAIVRRVVERHGGRVWAEGEVDAGATFYFTLPARGADGQ